MTEFLQSILQSDVFRELGAAILMFVVFYLTLQFFKTSIETLIKQQSDFMANMFALYNKLLDTSIFNSTLLQKINEKIKLYRNTDNERNKQ